MAGHDYVLGALRIHSELRLPELTGAVGFAVADVTIRMGAVPETIPHFGQTTEGYLVGPEQCLISIPNVARYLVENGCAITVEPVAGSDPGLVRFYLLGAAFVGLYFQRGEFPLHAGAVALRGGAVAFLGFSMQGKSTLVAALASRGHRILSDDRVLIRTDGARPVVLASVPVLNLTTVAAKFTAPADAQLLRETMNYEKQVYGAQARYLQDPVPLRSIVFLEWEDTARIQLDELDRFDALTALREQVNYESYVRLMRLEPEFFNFAVSLVSRVPCYRLRRPQSFESMPAVLKLLEQLDDDSD